MNSNQGPYLLRKREVGFASTQQKYWRLCGQTRILQLQITDHLQLSADTFAVGISVNSISQILTGRQ